MSNIKEQEECDHPEPERQFGQRCGCCGLFAEMTLPNPPEPLAANREARGQDGSIRKAHYGEGEQPWDTGLRLGWAPQAAAFCVLRYLRRDKAKEHSLESARWYWARLIEKAQGSSALVWYQVLQELRRELTSEELALLGAL